MTETVKSSELYPLPADKFYPIPEDDAKRLRDFFCELDKVGLDEHRWYYWFVGFLGAPVSIGQIDELFVMEKVLAERERCAKIVESYQWMEPGDYNDSDDPRPGMAELIRKGE